MTKNPISKTIFLDFLFCSKNMWLKLHKPELLHGFQISEFEKNLMEQGNEVESCARNLFCGGIEVVSTGEGACRETLRLMTSKIPIIYQATFIVEGFIARNDILVHNQKTGKWDLYEVKATNSLKEDSQDHGHLDDVAFQVSVLKRAKIELGRCFVIHMNKDYVRQGELDFNALFQIEDVSDRVQSLFPDIEKKMKIALEYLTQENEPAGNCQCMYKVRRHHCGTFKYSNNKVPDYSIHDLSYVTKKKLDLLIEKGIFDINDIPNDFVLSDNQRNQVISHQNQRQIIDKEGITGVLNSLKFPLYFFDYEAYGPAIPAFDGYSPYKRIPFQFSLHILESKSSELRHVEFLHNELSDPSQQVASILKENILPGGTVITWHKSYEAGVNREIGLRLNQYIDFFEKMNGSLHDLKEIFSKQLFIHPGFKGKSSIKKVLPTLIPNMHYSELDIRDGAQAAEAWWKMVAPTTSLEEKKRISRELKIYCGMDTLAMYKIWQHLEKMVS